MGFVYSDSITLEVMVCGGCGIAFGVPVTWLKNKKAERGGFSCPNSCTRRFAEMTELEKSEREKKEMELKLQSEINSERHARLAIESQLTKLAKEKKKMERRIHAGVCPCCNRTFTNLANHMKSQHPKQIEGGNVRQIA